MRLGKVRHESKYLAIEYFHTEKNWSIGWMCKHLEVARAAYYKWLHRETPEDEMENIKLAELIKEYDERFSHILGYRRMTSWINHFNQTKYSKNRVHRIMKKLGIHSVIRKKKKKYRNANADETTTLTRFIISTSALILSRISDCEAPQIMCMSSSRIFFLT